MAQDLFEYDKMVERALRGVVRDALKRAAREGLKSEHHFYLGFATTHPGVVIPEALRARYPEEMTIVLQHQFWDLDVGEDSVAVTLSFQRQLERLVVPFAAIRSFADPSVNFALEFAVPEPQAAEPGTGTASVEALPPVAPRNQPPGQPADQPPGQPPGQPDAQPTAEVVPLDSFRKR